jgi:hypothetical protein
MSYVFNLRVSDSTDGRYDTTGRPRENYRQDWETIVGWYSARNLTKGTDRLSAISALAREMRTSSEWKYDAGLWVETLSQGLCWTVPGTTLANHRTSMSHQVGAGQVWMAVEYAGQFNAEFTDKIINWEAKVVNINTDIQGKNDLGAVKEGSYLVVQGLMVQCTLEVPGMMCGINAKCCQLSPARNNP